MEYAKSLGKKKLTAAAATVFERVISTTGAKATEARIRTNNKISVRTSESAVAAASSAESPRGQGGTDRLPTESDERSRDETVVGPRAALSRSLIARPSPMFATWTTVLA